MICWQRANLFPPTCKTRRPDPMMGAWEKQKMVHPSSYEWALTVFSNLERRKKCKAGAIISFQILDKEA